MKVVWFKRDLRLHDHEALHEALSTSGKTLNDCPLPVPLGKNPYLWYNNLKIPYYEFTQIF